MIVVGTITVKFTARNCESYNQLRQLVNKTLTESIKNIDFEPIEESYTSAKLVNMSQLAKDDIFRFRNKRTYCRFIGGNKAIGFQYENKNGKHKSYYDATVELDENSIGV